MYPIWGTLIGSQGGVHMKKSAMIRARVEPQVKEQAETIFKKIGLNASEAIGLFYYQVKLGNIFVAAVIFQLAPKPIPINNGINVSGPSTHHILP